MTCLKLEEGVLISFFSSKLMEMYAGFCNCRQAFETACKLLKLHASSGNCMQAHGTTCKLMELHASECNCMQPLVTIINLGEP